MEKERLLEICQKALEQKGLNDELHVKRLAWEMKEIDAQNEYDYFLDLYNKKIRYSENQNNLLVPYLLGVVDNVDINREPITTFGDFPDVDTDYLPMIRDYLKNEWASQAFGQEKVCNIGSYNTFGIKSSLINMARVFNKDRNTVLELTTQMGLKDDDGNTLVWDKALEIYPAFKKYCEDNPEVAEAARRLVNRNNSMGKHAGGLIVSSTRIDNFVPLVKDKEGTPLSAWVEGLHGQDLSPMGLVKFDLLVITNLMQIALACKFIKERYKVENICSIEGQSDWSDTSYLNDTKALAMADKGDLKCVFQFDSVGIRQMAKDGGVTSFEDLVAYTSLYRPSSLSMKMHERYIERKRGREQYEIHPLLQPVLGKTYGIMCYQEQVMQILNIVGDIPLKDCEIVRKAISKKKLELFSKYKEMFVANGQKNLGWTEEKVKDFWDQIEMWAGYGFNRSHAVAYTYISSRLLWLKAHYPLEFFAAILSCEGQTEKLKEYKNEAARHGVKVMPIDINKSGVTFKIVDDCIYFGFSNIKGIGEVAAKRIVENQPYNNFESFLEKFGTDASVIKPLLGLRLFEGDPIYFYKYCKWYKEICKRKEDRRKRIEKRCAELTNDLKNLLPPSLHEELAVFTSEVLSKTKYILESRWPLGECPELDERINDLYDDILDLHKQYHRSINNYNKKLEVGLSLYEEGEFDPNQIEIDEKLVEIYNSLEKSEMTYYGFLWTHPLEKSPDYTGLTFELHRSQTKSNAANAVECRINSVEKKISKKNTEYYSLQLEDAYGEMQNVQIWLGEWERFGEDFIKEALIRIRLRLPNGGFKSYTMESWPKWPKHKDLTPKRKIDDCRVVVLRKGLEA